MLCGHSIGSEQIQPNTFPNSHTLVQYPIAILEKHNFWLSAAVMISTRPAFILVPTEQPVSICALLRQQQLISVNLISFFNHILGQALRCGFVIKLLIM
jgi:hypothetical protein